ncbi:MAG: hypothetical protein MUC83_14720 [Pirellula sp.]|nr:hypothetical protein [Pirellula sp.]
MKVLGWVLVVLVIVAILGFYRGWFSITTQSNDTTMQNSEVKLQVDEDKIDSDSDALKDKVRELSGGTKEPAKETQSEPNNLQTDR